MILNRLPKILGGRVMLFRSKALADNFEGSLGGFLVLFGFDVRCPTNQELQGVMLKTAYPCDLGVPDCLQHLKAFDKGGIRLVIFTLIV
jgi:hypothetical protein